MNDKNPVNDTGAADVSPRTAEVRRTHRVLVLLWKMAEQATLTGVLSRSAPNAVEQFNLILGHLRTLGVEPGPLFPPLPEDATIDRVGLVSRLLASYIEDQTRESERPPAPPPTPNLSAEQFGAPQDLERLRELGRFLRETMPELLTQQGRHPAAAIAPPDPATGSERMPPISSGDQDPIVEPTQPRS